MACYQVTAPCVVVGDRYLYRGAFLPKAVNQPILDHLVGAGLVTAVTEDDCTAQTDAQTGAVDMPADVDGSASADDSTADLEKMTVADLTEYAEIEGIDLGDARLKAEIIAAIVAGEAAKQSAVDAGDGQAE